MTRISVDYFSLDVFEFPEFSVNRFKNTKVVTPVLKVRLEVLRVVAKFFLDVESFLLFDKKNAPPVEEVSYARLNLNVNKLPFLKSYLKLI